MYCPYCGTHADDGSSYCPSCGKALKNDWNASGAYTYAMEESDEWSSNQDARKKKVFICTVLEAVSAAMALLSVLLLLFLPTYFNEYTTTVDGVRQTVIKQESVFVLCEKTVRMLINGNIKSFLFFGGLVWTLAVIGVLMCAVSAVKDVVVKVKHVVSFDGYYAKGEGADDVQDVVKRLKANQTGGFGGVIGAGIFMFVCGGYDGVVVGSLVAIGAVIVVGYLLGKCAKIAKKKVTK